MNCSEEYTQEPPSFSRICINYPKIDLPINITPSTIRSTPSRAPITVMVRTIPKITNTSPKIAPISLPVNFRIHTASCSRAQKGHNQLV